ncbi:hypothetical protein [Bacillus sp. MYb209]|uniref:hypothetical protein n=1 Tax=Bacillus sp. MYb209 TaxID=1848605 RepID=UPI0021572ADB|nr:hypothetical protein [Bacillus sp. MYb209]
MVPIDLAEVLKFIRKESFSVKELLNRNFQLESIVAAAEYRRPESFKNHTNLGEITGTRIINLCNFENVEDKKVALEILEFYIHQNCNMIYSIIDERFETINSNQAFKVLEGVKVSNNLI